MNEYTELPKDLPRPIDDGATAHLSGRVLPEIDFRTTAGDLCSLAELGDGRTVIYFYPLSGRPGVDLPEGWDEIPGARGCTPEACGFRDHYEELLAAGVTNVYGFSSQESDYQREFVERLHLPFAILSDPELKLAAALSLPTFEVDDVPRYRRFTLIVEKGLIEHIFYPIFPPNEHAQRLLEWLAGSHRV